MKLKLNLIAILLSLVVACGNSGDDDTGEKGGGEFTVQAYDPVAVNKTNAMKLYVHYMPWFETPETSDDGKWGQHWTMANKNPDKTGTDGKREIAAYYYPLIGPYASGDADVIEYHLLMMKYAGIDGILIDWYGTRDYYDYAANRRNTEAIVEGAMNVGMDVAIVYEDQTLRDGLSDSERITQAQADMRYLQSNFFNKDNYVKIGGRPLLMTFGPQTLTTPSDWTSVLAVLSTNPVFLTLYAHSGAVNNASNTNGQGEYIWVDAASMETKYAAVSKYDVWMGGAYPGFKAFYKDGGWGDNPLADIAYQDGALLRQLLQMAKEKNAAYLQLITWNDFGEGTMIEPTRELGYTFLKEIQSFAGTTYAESALSDIYRYYQLKKTAASDDLTKKKLRQIHYYLVSLQTEKAKTLMDELE